MGYEVRVGTYGARLQGSIKLARSDGQSHQLDELNISAIGDGRAAHSIEPRSSAGERKFEGRAECSFDYSSVDAPVARFLKGQAERIRRQSATTVLQIGNALVEAKRYLSHGNFLIWVEWEVGITARTAQLYMRAALWSSKKGKVVKALPLSLVYLLSAPTTPSDFADDVVERAAAGIPISLASIRRELKELTECAESGADRDLNGDTNVTVVEKSRSPSHESESHAVTKLIAILARELPKEHFASIRNVLTTGMAIDHSELAEIVASALSAIPE